MANITKRKKKDGSTVYKITVAQGRDQNGRQVRRYMTFTPPPSLNQRQATAAAKKAAQEFEDKLIRGYEADNRQTFAEYAEYVLDLKERDGCKRRTLDDYRNMLIRINAALGHLKLTDIRPAHLNALYRDLGREGIRAGADRAVAKPALKETMQRRKISAERLSKSASVSAATVCKAVNGERILSDKGKEIAAALGLKFCDIFKLERNISPLSNKTIVEHHRLISTILHQADKEMIVQYNAAAKASPPRIERKEATSLQPNDVNAILYCLEDEPIKWRTIVHLLIVTGCRRGEIAGLKWSKIDWKNELLLIDTALLYSKKRGIYEDTTKTGNARRIKLPAETMQQLQQYRNWFVLERMKRGQNWVECDYVFVRDGGGAIHPDSINTWLSKFSDKYGFAHINPHKFRHTMASLLISGGTDTVTVSKRLGHAKVSTTTDIYSHIIQKADVAAGEYIGNVIFGKNK